MNKEFIQKLHIIVIPFLCTSVLSFVILQEKREKQVWNKRRQILYTVEKVRMERSEAFVATVFILIQVINLKTIYYYNPNFGLKIKDFFFY